MRRLAAILTLVLVCAGCSGGSAPGSPDDRLRDLAARTAEDYHSHLDGARAVLVSRATAGKIVPPSGTSRIHSNRVWLVELAGTKPFECECTLWPAKPPAQVGTSDTYLLVVVDPDSYEIDKAAVIAGRTYLERLGDAHRL